MKEKIVRGKKTESKNLPEKNAVKKPVIKAQSAKKTHVKKEEPKPALKLLALERMIAPRGAHKKRKLLGRGPGSGHGKTSTRGSKGQTSRAGRHFYLGFEGGQSPLIRKMPKRGFVSNFKKIYQIVNLKDLDKIKGPVISPEVLKNKGLIRDKGNLVKILAKGNIKNPVTVQAHAFSKNASTQITAAGGKIEIIPLVVK